PSTLFTYTTLFRSGLVNGFGGQFNRLGDLGGLLGGKADQRIDVVGNDLLGSGLGHFLDVHATFARGNEGHLLRCAVGDHGHVVFLLDVGAFFDVQATHLLAFGAGLVGNELHAQDLGSQL